jgi:hypothetical protein
MQLTQEPVVVVLDPFSCIICVVEFDLDICTFVDPRHIDNAKLVACKGGETAVTLTRFQHRESVHDRPEKQSTSSCLIW